MANGMSSPLTVERGWWKVWGRSLAALIALIGDNLMQEHLPPQPFITTHIYQHKTYIWKKNQKIGLSLLE